MKGFITAVRQRWVIAAILLIATGIQLFLISRPLDFLLANVLPDDAFYYFEVAQRIVLGQGSTFDGVHPTNGYHPLWMTLLIPIYAIFGTGMPGDLIPIRVALFISVIFNVITGLLLVRVLSRISTRPGVQAIGLLLWSLSPLILIETINGLETSISLLLLVAFFLAALRAEEGSSRIRYVTAGILAGGMVLARLDLAIYAVAYALWLLTRHGIFEGMKRAVAVGLIALTVASPWFIWNYMTFGMVLTSASNANILVNHALVAQDNGEEVLVSARAAIYLILHHGSDVLTRTGAGWLIWMLLGAASVLLISKRRELPQTSRMLPWLLAAASGLCALFLINVGVRFTARTWYFVSGMLFVSALAVWVTRDVEIRTRFARGFVVLGIATVLSSYLLVWYTEFRNQHANEREMYAMALWMDEHLPENTRVGVFNAGVQAYFSKMTVVNLDGLINNSAYEAMREETLWSYIEHEVAYVSDFDLYLTYRYRSFFGVENVYEGLEEVHRIAGAPGTRLSEGIALYMVRTTD